MIFTVSINSLLNCNFLLHVYAEPLVFQIYTIIERHLLYPGQVFPPPPLPPSHTYKSLTLRRGPRLCPPSVRVC